MLIQFAEVIHAVKEGQKSVFLSFKTNYIACSKSKIPIAKCYILGRYYGILESFIKEFLPDRQKSAFGQVGV